MTRAQRQLDRLVTTIERLAEDPDGQRGYLRHLGTQGLTDELALEFDDALQPLRHQFDLLGVPTPVVAMIEALANLLSAMGGGNREWLWRPDALDGPEWSNVRQIAAEIVQELGAKGDEAPDHDR